MFVGDCIPSSHKHDFPPHVDKIAKESFYPLASPYPENFNWATAFRPPTNMTSHHMWTRLPRSRLCRQTFDHPFQETSANSVTTASSRSTPSTHPTTLSPMCRPSSTTWSSTQIAILFQTLTLSLT